MIKILCGYCSSDLIIHEEIKDGAMIECRWCHKYMRVEKDGTAGHYGFILHPGGKIITEQEA